MSSKDTWRVCASPAGALQIAQRRERGMKTVISGVTNAHKLCHELQTTLGVGGHNTKSTVELHGSLRNRLVLFFVTHKQNLEGVNITLLEKEAAQIRKQMETLKKRQHLPWADKRTTIQLPDTDTANNTKPSHPDLSPCWSPHCTWVYCMGDCNGAVDDKPWDWIVEVDCLGAQGNAGKIVGVRVEEIALDALNQKLFVLGLLATSSGFQRGPRKPAKAKSKSKSQPQQAPNPQQKSQPQHTSQPQHKSQPQQQQQLKKQTQQHRQQTQQKQTHKPQPQQTAARSRVPGTSFLRKGPHVGDKNYDWAADFESDDNCDDSDEEYSSSRARNTKVVQLVSDADLGHTPAKRKASKPQRTAHEMESWGQKQVMDFVQEQGWSERFWAIVVDVLGDARCARFDWRIMIEEWMQGEEAESAFLFALEETLNSLNNATLPFPTTTPTTTSTTTSTDASSSAGCSGKQWDVQLADLRSMGFSERTEELVAVLDAVQGDVPAAVEQLFARQHNQISNNKAATPSRVPPGFSTASEDQTFQPAQSKASKKANKKNKPVHSSPPAPQQQQQQQQQHQTPQQRDQEKAVDAVVNMGFRDRDFVRDCLRHVGWDVSRACELLVGQTA